MKDEKTIYQYFPEWMPTGEGCNNSAAYGTIEKGDYYG